MALHHSAGLGIGMAGLAGSGSQHSRAGLHHSSSMGQHQPSGLQDLMTDSSQLPSSACPTPLHSPLFSATNASGPVHHHSSGEPVVSGAQSDKIESIGTGDVTRGEDNIMSHLDLDIGKEMEGFQQRLAAKSKAAELVKPVITNEPSIQSSRLEDEDVDVDVDDEDEEESLKAVLLNATF